MPLSRLSTFLCLVCASVCAAKTCPGGSVAVQSINDFPSSNGCSKPAGISVGGEEDFTYCCDRHDVCYSTCGISKEYCEKDFQQCMTTLCKTVFSHNPQCEAAATVYTMGTSIFGGSGFQDLQDKYCDCVAKDKVREHYKNIFRKIYKNHSGKNEDETASIISKLMSKIPDDAKSDRKLGYLFYKIIKKYDSAIGHEGDRRGKKPPAPKAEL